MIIATWAWEMNYSVVDLADQWFGPISDMLICIWEYLLDLLFYFRDTFYDYVNDILGSCGAYIYL